MGHTLQKFQVVHSKLNKGRTHYLFFHFCLYLLLMQLFLLNSLHPFLFFRASSFTDHSHYLRIHALLHSAIVLCERFDWRDINTAAIVFYRCRPSCHVRLQHYGEELLLIDLILCQMVNTAFY